MWTSKLLTLAPTCGDRALNLAPLSVYVAVLERRNVGVAEMHAVDRKGGEVCLNVALLHRWASSAWMCAWLKVMLFRAMREMASKPPGF